MKDKFENFGGVKIYNQDDFPEYLPRLNELYDALFSSGKGFRGQLVTQMASFAKVSADTTKLLAQTVEFIHNSSLLHDDLIDQSSLRRGKTAAWKEFGPEYAVLAGDYLLARVMVNLSQKGHVGLLSLTSQSISDLLEGEWLQDSIRYQYEVSSEQMNSIHKLKTSSLFSWCLKAPFVCKDYDEKVIKTLDKIGENLGLLLQRSDDLLDFDIRNFEGKTNLTDLKAGYLNSFSLQVFQTESERKRAYELKTIEDLINLVTQNKLDEDLKIFDQMSEALMNETLSLAAQLQKQTGLDNQFYQFIEEMTPQLYWRS